MWKSRKRKQQPCELKTVCVVLRGTHPDVNDFLGFFRSADEAEKYAERQTSECESGLVVVRFDLPFRQGAGT